jgi:hypothetical protein
MQAQLQKQGKSLPFLGSLADAKTAAAAAAAADGSGEGRINNAGSSSSSSSNARAELKMSAEERATAADKIRVVCVQCLLKLLLARPTFNHADELMTIAVALADGVHAGSRALAAAAVVKIFLGEVSE